MKQALHKQHDSDTVADASSDGWDRMADEALPVAKLQIKAAQHVFEMICKHMERVCKPEAKADREAVEVERLTMLV